MQCKQNMTPKPGSMKHFGNNKLLFEISTQSTFKISYNEHAQCKTSSKLRKNRIYLIF